MTPSDKTELDNHIGEPLMLILEYVLDSDILPMVAKVYGKMRDELIANGFTHEDAVNIIQQNPPLSSIKQD